MVRLCAYHAFEGAGVVETADGKLVYVDFPYTLGHQYPCSVAQLQSLIIRMNFEGSDLEFPDFPELIAFLKAKANEGPDPFASETEESILEGYNALDAEDLEGIVDAIAKLYVQTKDYRRAIRALERIVNLKSVKQNTYLKIKVLQLLNDCRKEIYEVVSSIKEKPLADHQRTNAPEVRAPGWATRFRRQRNPRLFRQERGPRFQDGGRKVPDHRKQHGGGHHPV